MTSSSKTLVVCVLIMIAGIGALSYWSQIRYEEDRAWVRHTRLVVETLQTLRIDIAQAETGQRGFLLAGQQRHMEMYLAGLQQIGQDVTQLSALISDNPSQRDAAQRLYTLITARLMELGAGIEVRKKSGLLAGVEVVAHGNKGEELMEKIAAQVAEMRQTEAQLLSTRLDTAANGARTIKIIIVYGNALAILVLMMKGYVIHREISKRNLAEQNLKQANERLESRTAELSETNIEMESFAYSVAHDLRAPLRHIAGYSGVLKEDYASRLDAEGMRYLEKIREGAQKMGRLVDDLLGLSQVGRQELSLQDTSLDMLLGQAIEDLAPNCAGRQVEWRLSELFSVVCDPGLMKQVFANLLSNAVKYTSKREHAVIQVGHTVQDDEHVIFVRDNGAGFEMQYVEKLFGIFQRLHKARDFEGTGVGLAIVQRIIRKHCGRIWAEGEPDRGATFFFTLGTPENKASNKLGVPIAEEEMYVARS